MVDLPIFHESITAYMMKNELNEQRLIKVQLVFFYNERYFYIRYKNVVFK